MLIISQRRWGEKRNNLIVDVQTLLPFSEKKKVVGQRSGEGRRGGGNIYYVES